MKRPSFQFYPADWQKNVELQSCSIAARGLWIQLSCVMHQCEPYGHLTLGGKPMPDDKAARLCGVDLSEYRRLLRELEDAGVPSRTEEKTLFSRRMVKDEAARQVKAQFGALGAEHGKKGAEHGVKGGRPRNDGGNKTPHHDGEGTGSTTPISSSASASASETSKHVGPPPCPYDRLVALYHEHLPTHPRVLTLNDKRRAMTKRCWAFFWQGRRERDLPCELPDLLERFRIYFAEEVSTSRFLDGRAPPQDDRPPFIANFEWLMNHDNALKVLEGKYLDEPKVRK